MRCGNILAVRPLILGAATALAVATGAKAQDSDDAVPFALPQSGPFTPAEIDIENDAAITDWFRSAHANAAAEAFRHWDEDGEIRPACAT